MEEFDDWNDDWEADGAAAGPAASAADALCSCGAGLRWGGGDDNEPVDPIKYRTIKV